MISIDSGRLSWLCIRTSRYTKPTKRCTRFKIVLTLQLNGWSPLGLCLPENCRLTQYRRPAILLAFLGRPETQPDWASAASREACCGLSRRRPEGRPSTAGLSRRSGRIPAEPYPPIKPLPCTATADRDDKPTIHSGRKLR